MLLDHMLIRRDAAALTAAPPLELRDGPALRGQCDSAGRWACRIPASARLEAEAPTTGRTVAGRVPAPGAGRVSP